MQHILVYGDSLSWGIIPTTRQRLAFERRWAGILESGLKRQGLSVRVTEDCLNGRRTAWDDPYKAGRNGRDSVSQSIEIHAPLALVIVALGTNDFQSMHQLNAWHSAQGMAALVAAIRQAPIEPGMPVAPILLLAPPPIAIPKGPLAEKFAGAQTKCIGLAAAYQEIAASLGCHFFDAGSVTAASRVDGIHLDADQHQTLGLALIPLVATVLSAT